MRIFPLILAVFAVAFLFGGLNLIAVGGSSFYALTGLALAAIAVLLWLGSYWGSWLYTALFVATVGWSLWEVGLDAWALLPRIWLIAAVGAWLLIDVPPVFSSMLSESFPAL